jgi:hypothetical protein
VAYTNFVLEPNARRHDNMGFNMPLAMVQADINSTSLYPRNLESLTRAAANQILFLNKDDLFQKKILHSDIKTFFPVSDLSMTGSLY